MDKGLHNLSPAKGSRKERKRVGRGEGSGHGKTSGRGHKGAGARSGSKRRARFEGGQNPLQMRMRKLRGPTMKKSMPFEQYGRTRTQPVNLSDLEERFDKGAEVTPDALRQAGLATRRGVRGEGARQRRAHQGAHGPRPRLLRHRAREDRGGGRQCAGGRGLELHAQDLRQRLPRPRHPQEAAVHGGDACAVPARLLHPGPRDRHRRGREGRPEQRRRATASWAC